MPHNISLEHSAPIAKMGIWRRCLAVLGISDLPPRRPRERCAFPQDVMLLDTDINALQEIQQFGDAPVRGAPAGLDRERYAESDTSTSNHHHHHHKLHFPGHRHTRSREEPPKPPSKDSNNGYPIRPSKHRQDSSASLRTNLKDSISAPIISRSTMPVRGSSPTPSINSGTSRNESITGQRSPADGHSGKRTIFDKFRRHKGERGPNDSLSHLLGSTRSLHDSLTEPRYDSSEYSPQKVVRNGSIATFDSGSTAKPGDATDLDSPSSKKETNPSRILHSHGKFPRPKRNFSYESQRSKDADRARKDSVAKESLLFLDTNLDDMEGIVNPVASTGSASYGGIFVGEKAIDEEPRKASQDAALSNDPGAWDAPDSWAVKKEGEEIMGRLREIDETGTPQKVEDDGTPHCVRVFRIDSTFATLSTGVNTTVSEILQMLGKKSFLQDDLDNYQIIMRKHDLQRQLAPGERPVAIQKRLLEQAGYTSKDRIEEIGREDNSYLCRFTFVPTKLSGYYSLEKDPTHGKMQKFSSVDLSGRSLVTIPITLYQKATEIISLNLSRNLALDVPKDFIQGCANLREIKFVSNEAWQLPPSFSLATRLTVLDLSNNRLEQLEHAELDKLQSLTSIKLSNNKLKHLPAYFGNYRALRSLNISSNYFETFPNFLCGLTSLVDLDISFNTIKSLPNIGQLTALERFWATNNLLSDSFTEDFKNLKNLREIDIRFNGLSNIDVLCALPGLEQLMVGHNAISQFKGNFNKIRILYLDHNPVTVFDLKTTAPGLASLNIASAKLSELEDSIFERMPNLTKLNLDKNHFAGLSSNICKLTKLEYLSITQNPLNSLPASIGKLERLHFLDVRECNLKKLPIELWNCFKLDTLNVSSNVLESFPKLTAPQQEKSANETAAARGNSAATSPSGDDELGKLEDFGHRRPSQPAGGLLSVGTSPGGSTRNGSIVSIYGPGGRKASVISRTPTDGSLCAASPDRKEPNKPPQKLLKTFAGSLKHLYMADNRLTDDVFDDITMLPELRVLNLSYNEIYDIPQGSLCRWQHLNELYLSGNELTSLPSEDLEDIKSLKVLHINGNKFQGLPAELGKLHKLAILDVGSNSLRYNVSNWPYDWNWNWNRNLKYLNFSGNKRLEIKPSRAFAASGGQQVDLTSFSILHNLRILGLMDVTLTTPAVPEQNEDRRIRTSGSLAGSMAYGMADSLGKHEHLSTIDMVVPKFRGHDTETLLGMFDGQASSTGGSKLAQYLHDNFQTHFSEELDKVKKDKETGGKDNPMDALRRSFLALNKDLATAASQTFDEKEHRIPQTAHRGSITAQQLTIDDLNSGGVATVAFLDNMELYLANVGDAQAYLFQSDGMSRSLTRKHNPERERSRIREAGGYVSRHGKLNDVLEVSRAFGYIQMMPAVMAAPDLTQITLKENDEMILIASRELWEYLTVEFVVDVARSERGDLMRAAQKLRDLAMAFGATGKIMVMMIGVSDLKKRERSRYRGQSLSMGPTRDQDEQQLPTKGRGPKRRETDRPDDSTLQRLDREIDPPTGDLAMIFTDIKNSTALWEAYPVAMRSAIKTHNMVMRRQLRLIGGYEVKTEGDAFMVCFPTATSALLWCFSVQAALLEAPWPAEILSSVHCAEVQDSEENTIFRGLSVRMGMHWGNPVCEMDPVTRRMDYFGPMVNRASRVSGAADGGQIYVSSDFIGEIQRTLETYADSDRSGSTGSDEANEDPLGAAIRRELRSLSSQGFEVKDLGQSRLKGLENPEYLFMMYPHSLAGRLGYKQQLADAEAATASNQPGSMSKDSQLTFDTQNVWDLWSVSLRLEMLCSALECPGSTALRPPETSLLERIKNRGGEQTDRFLVNFVEHQVSRIEVSPGKSHLVTKSSIADLLSNQTCISTLAMRNMIRPFDAARSLLEQACPMDEILRELSAQLAEFKELKENRGPIVGGRVVAPT